MTFRKKTYILSGLIAILFITFILTIVLDPERRSERASYYSWLDPSYIREISEIIIEKPNFFNEESFPIVLKKIDGTWFASIDDMYFPAFEPYIQGFLAILSRRDKYEIRSSNASVHEQLHLSEDFAVKVTLLTEEESVLKVLFGKKDDTDKNIFMRLQNQNEIRIGEDIFSSFINSDITAWYDLRLFPQKPDEHLAAESVQRITVKMPQELYEDGQEGLQVFSRNYNDWDTNFDIDNFDIPKMERYVNTLLAALAVTFTDMVSIDDPLFDYSSIEVEFGFPPVTKQIRVGPLNEFGAYYTSISDSEYVYLLPQWLYGMMFRRNEYFDVNFDISQQRIP